MDESDPHVKQGRRQALKKFSNALKAWLEKHGTSTAKR